MTNPVIGVPFLAGIYHGYGLGHIVTVHSLAIDSFSATVVCDTGYIGTGVATACTMPGESFRVRGCSRALACQAPADTTGYTINPTGQSLHVASFHVRAHRRCFLCRLPRHSLLLTPGQLESCLPHAK